MINWGIFCCPYENGPNCEQGMCCRKIIPYRWYLILHGWCVIPRLLPKWKVSGRRVLSAHFWWFISCSQWFGAVTADPAHLHYWAGTKPHYEQVLVHIKIILIRRGALMRMQGNSLRAEILLSKRLHHVIWCCCGTFWLKKNQSIYSLAMVLLMNMEI